MFNDYSLCRWVGCTANRAPGSTHCPAHTTAYNRKTNGGDGTDRSRGAANPMSDDELAEIRRRLSRFENPAAIARSLGITKSGLFKALARRAS